MNCNSTIRAEEIYLSKNESSAYQKNLSGEFKYTIYNSLSGSSFLVSEKVPKKKKTKGQPEKYRSSMRCNITNFNAT